ncbi:MAG: hypothetical protein QM831_11870 [Kofleriaceae bacterium]
MSELAFNINGETFDLPANAAGWRVRRMKQRGAPEVVYGKDGVPMVVPLDANLDELRSIVGTPGRYRLDAIDERGRTVENLPAAYVVIPVADAASTTPEVRHQEGATFVMTEAMRLNTELAKAVVEKFPQMVEAAASLVRAADGAGLPARLPAALPEEEDEEVEIVGPAGFDLNALVAQLVPVLMTSLMSGKTKLPKVSEVLDWRKATPSAPKAELDVVAETVEVVAEPLPPIDAKTMSHFIAIQSVLDPDEAAIARDVAATLRPSELRTWFDELSQLTVADAVKKIRATIAKKGAAS